MKRKMFLSVLILVTMLLAACAAPTPEIIEKEVVVEKKVVETLEVVKEVVVEKKVVETVIVEKEVVVVVTATPVPPAPKGGELVFALRMEPLTLDAHRAYYQVAGTVIINIYDCLVIEDMVTHEMVPWLAKSWEVSGDGRTWTFHLRDDVKFHDGTPFNAEAVKYNFDRITDPDTEAVSAATFLTEVYEGIEIVDDYTVQIVLSEPVAPFLGNLGQPFLGMVSPTAAEEWGVDDFGSHPVGSGPFMFEKWDREDQIVLVKNPDYNWAPSAWKHQGPAYLDKLVYRIIPDDATKVAALELGEVHALGRSPHADFARLKADPSLTAFPGAASGTPQQMVMNVTKPPTDDLRFRQAVHHAIDRQAIVDTILFGKDIVALGSVSSNMPCYDESLAKNYPYPYDPDKAKALLDEAGWIDTDGDGIRDKDGEAARPLGLFSPGIASAWGEAVQAQLREVGIDMELLVPDVAAKYDMAAKGEHNFFNTAAGGVDPQILQSDFGSENIGTGSNFSHWSNEEFDGLVQEAMVTMDPEARCDLYKRAQRMIMENALTVPMYDRDLTIIARAEVHGIVIGLTGYYQWLYDTWVEER